MRAGLLRNSITVFAAGSAQDAFGQVQPTSSQIVLSTYASIAAISGKEVYALGAGFNAQVTHLITIRYPPVPVHAGMKVGFGSRVFLIQYPRDPDERRRQMDLICLEQQP